MSLKVERKEDKIYIQYENPDNEIEPVIINVEIKAKKFEECVKKERERGTENPELNVMLRFILYGEDIEC
jgi:hypothetical protein